MLPTLSLRGAVASLLRPAMLPLCLVLSPAAPQASQAVLAESASAPDVDGLLHRWWAGGALEDGISGLTSRWFDTAGGGIDLFQNQGHRMPYHAPLAADGHGALRFDGNDWLYRVEGMPQGSQTRAISFRLDDAKGGMLVGSNTGDGLRMLFNDLHPVLEQGGATLRSDKPLILGEYTTLVLTYDAEAGQAEMFLDGAPVASGPMPPTAEPQIGIGATYHGAYPMIGEIAEVQFYDRALDASERALVEANLERYRGSVRPTVVFESLPRDAQILTRDDQDRAPIEARGTVVTPGYAKATLVVTRDGEAFGSVSQNLAYGSDGAPFDLSLDIFAELAVYDASIVLEGRGEPVTVIERHNLACGDAFVITGQSNSVAKDWHGEGLGNAHQSFWIRSFGDATNAVLFMPPVLTFSTHPRDLHWDLADSLLPHKHCTIGQWALRMAEILVEREQIPIAILNGGVEASSIAQHQRNDLDPTDATTYYGTLLHRTIESGVVDRVRALFYYQGEADGGIPLYWGNKFGELRDDWLVDYHGLERIYAFQIREGCNIENSALREIQRTLGDVYPDVSVMSTCALLTHDLCHYYYVGYRQLGEDMAHMVSRDLYGLVGKNIDPPQIRGAAWTTGDQDELLLTFGPDGDDLVALSGVESFVTVDDGVEVTSVKVTGPMQLTVGLANRSAATSISWIGHLYDGPWICNDAGVGALTFFDFPITPFTPGR